VSAVRGEWENEKLTWPEQIPWFSLLLAERRPRSAPPNGDKAKKDANKGRASERFRVGLGFDAHRFADHRALWLGGVRIDHPRGLLGHSDADVVCHAVGDGVLGAVHKGDIGLHFSDRDPRWRDLAGVALLERTAAMARGEGWKILSVDVVVIAEHPPRLADCRNQMERRIAFALGLSNDAVSVKATTSEGMGFVGRKEGIAAQAAVLVGRRC
jgi:2-C-methyl-D-erythritol 2,4-cyclodiphosphate synthase